MIDEKNEPLVRLWRTSADHETIFLTGKMTALCLEAVVQMQTNLTLSERLGLSQYT